MSSERDAVLGRVRAALGKRERDAKAIADAQAIITAHRQGPRPRLPADLVLRFLQRATDMESTVERIGNRLDIPAAVARYLDALVLPERLAPQKSRPAAC